MINLILTDYDTVKSTSSKSFEEMPIKEFLFKLERQLNGKGVLRITYNSLKKYFEIETYDSVYSLTLSEEFTKNYEEGKYTEETVMLKRLVDKCSNKRAKEDDQKSNDIRISSIVSEIDRTGKIPSESDREVYIKYLKQQLKPNVKEYFKNLALDAKKSSRILNKKVWPYCDYDSNDIAFVSSMLSLVTSLIGLVVGLATSRLILGLIVATIMIPLNIVYPILVMAFLHGKERAKRLVNRINTIKLTKFKIKSLSKKADNAKFFSEKIAQIDEKDTESKEAFHTETMRQINALIQMLDGVGVDDRKIFANDLKILLTQFFEKFTVVMSKKSSNGINLGGFDNLRISTLNQINEMELKIKAAAAKEKCIRAVKEDSDRIQKSLESVAQVAYGASAGAQLQLRRP